MINLNLENNEGILLQTTNVERYNENNEFDVYELYLTNKHLIVVYEKSSGFFSKSETAIDKISLETINVVDGIPQVNQVTDSDYGKVLQIIYTNGKRELFKLYGSPKREYPKWKNAISEAVLKITGNIEINDNIQPLNVANTSESKLNEASRYSEWKSTIYKSTIYNTSAKIVNNIKERINEMQGDENKNVGSKQRIFCRYCGIQLAEDAKFCSNCGKSTQEVTISNSENTKNSQPKQENFIHEDYTERKTVYDGKIHKCPNCGEVLKSFVTTCPACGYEIRDANTPMSLHEFTTKLQEIEDSRPPKKIGLKDIYVDTTMINETDKRSISLIRNFTIPNTKEDLIEFLILASSNINIKSYQDYDRITESQKAVSDAWMAKFEQAYEKAKIIFGNTPEFKGIQDIYDKKINEINKTKKLNKWIWIGMSAFIVIPLIFLFIWLFYNLFNI